MQLENRGQVVSCLPTFLAAFSVSFVDCFSSDQSLNVELTQCLWLGPFVLSIFSLMGDLIQSCGVKCQLHADTQGQLHGHSTTCAVAHDSTFTSP